MSRPLVLLLMFLLLPALAVAQEPAYQVEFVVGDNQADLTRRIEEASRLRELADKPPASRLGLDRRIDEERERIQAVLRSEGHYAGQVDARVEAGTPDRIRITVEPGPRFKLSAFALKLDDPDGAADPPEVPLSELGIEVGMPARARPIDDAFGKAAAYLQRRGYPLAREASRDIVVDHATQGMRVSGVIDTGRRAHFGPVAVRGLADVQEDYVLRRIPWQPGERYSAEQIEELRKALAETRLFSQIRIELADQVNAAGEIPITLTLAEREHRTWGGGLEYSTTEGIGVEAFWEHRNLFGEAERLRAEAGWSQIRQRTELLFRNPDFGRSDLDLLGNGIIEREDTDAYRSRRAEASSGFEWRVSERWTLTALGAVERSLVEEDGVTRTYNLVSLPLRGAFDSSDDLLDPTRGGRFTAGVRPFFSVMGDGGNFTVLELGQTRYWQVMDEPRTVLAGWAQAGSIVGASRVEIPAEKRFYAGGGGSIRGYGYQMAGPLDADGEPIGGRSLLAFGGEARLRVTESIGVVPFLEGGSVYPESTPDLGQEILWGAGLGLRYVTPVGPVRFDFAVPLNPRRDDDRFQIYISLGQAF